jgi:hypothetical protein
MLVVGPKSLHVSSKRGSLENPQMFGSSFLLKEMMGPKKRQNIVTVLLERVHWRIPKCLAQVFS